MKYPVLVLIISFLFAGRLSSQGADYAGEDMTACQGAGAMIGNAGVTGVCYTWEMEEGLNPDDIHSQSIVVNPQHTTTYTVHITGDGFTFSTTDKVKVIVDFGGLVITPSYVDLSGPLSNQAQAELTINNFQGSPAEIIWSIENPGSTGCSITQNGVISNCAQTGSVKVRATNAEYPGCYAEKDLEINGGIKDLTAEDVANLGRIAHHGQTLYLVADAVAKLTAIPNENSTFPSGQPEWEGPDTPAPGTATFETPHLQPGTYNYEVGAIDPKAVAVIDLPENATTVLYSLDPGLLSDMLDLLTGEGTEVGGVDPFCSPPLEFSANIFSSIKASYKESNSVKYKDPGYDTKREVSIEIPAFTFEGCLFFPCCSGGANFGVVSAFYFTYFKAGLGLNLTANAIKDPNTPDPEWAASAISASITGSLEAGLRLEANVPSGFGFLGQANISTEAKLEGRMLKGSDKIEWNASWGGLVGKVSLGIWYLSMDNIIEVSQQRNFINGREVGWKTLWTVPN